MAAYFDHMMLRNCLKVWSQLLLLSIMFSLPVYAVQESETVNLTVL